MIVVTDLKTEGSPFFGKEEDRHEEEVKSHEKQVEKKRKEKVTKKPKKCDTYVKKKTVGYKKLKLIEMDYEEGDIDRFDHSDDHNKTFGKDSHFENRNLALLPNDLAAAEVTFHKE